MRLWDDFEAAYNTAIDLLKDYENGTKDLTLQAFLSEKQEQANKLRVRYVYVQCKYVDT